ncbi:MAG: ribonucleoside triphosphate reductase [Candidatus ainarchaeum sp.]|nr:ribonucleoside triphosphate reductase [Candidatus ainarchaeum sp.]
MPKFVVKRDGSKVSFSSEKIHTAIWKAVKSVGGRDEEKAKQVSEVVIERINNRFKQDDVPTVEQIQDIVEEILIKAGHDKVAKSYILYRHQHELMRAKEEMFSDFGVIDSYVTQEDWRVRENSNMSYSLQGLRNHISSNLISNYWLIKIYPSAVANAHKEGFFHIHDLSELSVYCVGWDLKQLLMEGFKGVRGKINCAPAKHFRSALGQIVNFFYTLQGEAAGAQAFSNFDTLLAPFIRYDNLSRKEVKQALQEFLFNCNVPTRVGFQCMSEDTEILTPMGWASYDMVNKGDKIFTFNIEKNCIEEKIVRKVFVRNYSGKMFNLKNRIQDQLISPKHRVVRKKFGSNNFILEEIESLLDLKTPIIIPIAGNNINSGIHISDNELKLLAWIIAEGTSEHPGQKHRQCGRITIYQSKIKNYSKYKEIISLLKKFKLNFSERDSIPALGSSTKMIRLNADSSRKIHSYFDDCFDIKHIPSKLMKMNTSQARIFLDTFIKADGFENCKIALTDKKILDGLQQICVLASYGSSVLIRKPTIGSKDIFVLRIIKHNETKITNINEINYNGVIWCPNTDNETVIARRNGKVFITGNTPFENITLDLKIPEKMKNLPVIVGGKPMEATYGGFQEEVYLFNDVLAEVMIDGDADGRIFTFPIPTYNITSDFDWDNKNLDNIWEMTAKYGIPYFSNFVNSDMKVEDSRSMCCRLRLNNKELEKRGGGLFGSDPMTGSVGVVTINLPRISYLAKDEKDFFERLSNIMDLARDSLVIKRKTLENLTTNGLYPYSAFYLRNMKKDTGQYWKNHFSTIGLIGMNEALINFLNKTIFQEEGIEFAKKIMLFMREKLVKYQEETGDLFNLEATPGEGTSYRLAKTDKKKYPDIVVANEKNLKSGASPYYTNSTQLPVNYTNDLFDALNKQDDLQSLYTGGTVFHVFVGEKLPSGDAAKNLIRKITSNYKLPYISLTPTFSICPIHGYISGEHEYCPICEKEEN